MDSNPLDPPHIPEAFDLDEEPDEFIVPLIEFSALDNPLPPPPPELEEERAVQGQVDYLNLHGLRTLSDPITRRTHILVRVEQLLPAACPQCGCDTELFKGNGTRRQSLLDEPRGTLAVRIDLRRRSFSCRKCGTSKLVPLDCIAEGRRMTRRLELYIQRKSLLRPFREIAHETGVSPKTVHAIFRDYVKALERERVEKCPMPCVLGLDGVYIKSKERAVLTDPERGLVIDLVPTVQGELLGKALSSMPGGERVEVVTIDMSHGLRLAVSYAFPRAVIVIDRYHIQRMANESVDRVRHRLRREIKRTNGGVYMCHRKLLRRHLYQLTQVEQIEMERYFRLFPELKLAYETKEAFFALWPAKGSVKDSVVVKLQYQEWRAACPSQVRSDFQPLLTAMENWGEYIFNYFDHPKTNAFTEASNRRIKDIQREGRGGSFPTVRAKIIFGTLMRQELKAAREQEPRYPRRHGTPRARGPRPQAVEPSPRPIRTRPLPVGLQLALF
jgi:transposase